ALNGPDIQIVGAPSVALFSGTNAAPLNHFTVFAPPFLGAVRVAATDFTGSGRADVIGVHGPGGPPDVDIFDPLTGQLVDPFFAFLRCPRLAFADGLVQAIALGSRLLEILFRRRQLAPQILGHIPLPV